MTVQPRLVPSTAPVLSPGRSERRSFQTAKISQAIEDEMLAGGMIEGLRPVEVRRRLVARMRLRGFSDAEIPSTRAFFRYFNGR